jgi:hypothetical protein
MSTRIAAVGLVFALVTCSVVHGQDRDRTDLWRSYADRLPPHALVVVQMKNGKSVRGHLVQVTDDRVVLLRKTRLRVPPSELAIADVESIEPEKDGWSPGAKVLASIGAAGGVMMIVVLAALARLD